ncbi:MAG: Ig-like domain-containing protein [Oscillospiraceae bacterium]|jgi:uncharacterized protein YjdB|nr:Ig-like domain-containing protein [Oscillospiraceae bacterium]
MKHNKWLSFLLVFVLLATCAPYQTGWATDSTGQAATEDEGAAAPVLTDQQAADVESSAPQSEAPAPVASDPEPEPQVPVDPPEQPESQAPIVTDPPAQPEPQAPAETDPPAQSEPEAPVETDPPTQPEPQAPAETDPSAQPETPAQTEASEPPLDETPPAEILPEPAILATVELSDPTGEYMVGDEIEWTAKIVGGVEPYQYEFKLYLNDEVYKVFDAQEYNTLKYLLEEPGRYAAFVTATDKDGAQATAKSDDVKVSSASLIVELAASADTLTVGGASKWTAQVQGGAEPYQYAFELYLNGESYVQLKAQESNILEYLLDAPGQYAASVTVTDKDGVQTTARSESVEAVEPIEPLTVELSNPAEAPSVGVAAQWVAQIQGGVAPYQYAFELYLDGTLYKQFPAQESAALEITPDAVGAYIVAVSATDAAGTQASAQAAAFEVADLAEEYEFEPIDITSIPGLNTWNGSGVVTQGSLKRVGGESEPFTVDLKYATLSELKVAYVSLNTAFLSTDSSSTWTAKAVGGDGVYYFQYDVMRATDTSGSKFVGEREYWTSTHTKSPTFTYTIKDATASHYWLNVLFADSNGKYVVYQTEMYDVANSAAFGDTSTVAGKVKQVVASVIKSGMSETQKAKALHDWIINNADPGSASHHSDGALLLGSGSARSYAEAYRLLCVQAGLQCMVVQSSSSKAVWNVVLIGGEWFHVDVLKDDPGKGYAPSSAYFLKKDEDMDEDHVLDNEFDGDKDKDFDGLFQTGDDEGVVIEALVFPKGPLNIEIDEYNEDNHYKLEYSWIPSNAGEPDLKWSSSDLNVVEVNSDGEIIPLALGTATISAVMNAKDGAPIVKASVEVNVIFNPNVINLTVKSKEDPKATEDVNYKTILITNKEELLITATVESYPGLENATVTWTSSNTAIAKVDANGRVSPAQPAKEGITKITAKTSNGITAWVNVNVRDETPKKIELDQSGTIEIDLQSVDKTTQLTYKLTPDYAITMPDWISSKPGVATVDADGLVTAVAEGTTVITVKTDNGLSDTVTVKVVDSQKPTKITLNYDGSKTINAGETLDLVATLEPAAAQEAYEAGDFILEWKLDESSVATVVNGEVTSLEAGTATITVRTPNGLTASLIIYVVSSSQPSAVTLEPTTLELDLGDSNTGELKPSLTPADLDGEYEDFIWTTSDDTVATVDANGTVTAVSEGKATITVRTKNGKTATATVTVSKSGAESITIDSTDLTVEVGDTIKLATNVSGTDDEELTWSTSATEIARVDDDGTVTGVSVGKAEITVFTSNGKHATVTVTVVEADITPTKISITPSAAITLDLGGDETATLEAVVEPAGAICTLEWNSTSPSTVSVDGGTVTAESEGTAYISVKTNNGKVSNVVQVTVINSNKPTSVAIVPSGTLTLALDSTYGLEAVVTPAEASTSFKWVSSNPQIVEVDADTGEIWPGEKAKNGSSADITVVTDNGRTAKVKVNIVSSEALKSIAFGSNAPKEVIIGEPLNIESYIVKAPLASDWDSITWKSSSVTYATVDEGGTVSGVKAVSSVTITATATVGTKKFTATLKLKVVDPTKPTSIKFDPSAAITLNLKNGAGTQDTFDLADLLVIAPETAEGDKLAWITSSSKYATVEDGVVTPKGEGTATITAKTSNGLTAKISVKVVDPFKPESVTLDKTTLKIETTNQSEVLTATLDREEASTTFTWTSSSTSILKIDQNGDKVTLKPQKEGTATVTVKTANGKSAKATVTVVDLVTPKSIKLGFTTINSATDTPVLCPSTVSLNKAEGTLTLYAIPTPETANVASTTWTSSVPAVATVSGTGASATVTAKSTGTTKITAKTSNGKTASVTIKVVDTDSVDSVALNLSGTQTLGIDESLQLIPQTIPTIAQTKFTWTSSSTAVAVVKNGVVTGLKEGTATIKVTTANGKTASVTVKVVNQFKETAVALTPSGTITINIFQLQKLSTQLTPSTAVTKYTWTSSNTKIATVSSSGIVTPVAEGSCTITVKTTLGKTAKVTVKIVDPYKPTAVKLEPTGTITLNYNKATELAETLQLSPHLTPDTAKATYTWTTSSSKVATVVNGLITPKGTGTATITVKTHNGKTAKITVKVVDPITPTAVALNKTGTVTLNTKEQLQLTAKLTPTTAKTDFTWSSSNSKVVQVDAATGEVTPLATGSATVTVKTGNGKSAKVTIKVVKAPTP